MRRLEHAGEDKFWEAWIKDDAIFCYRFGKIGTSGQTRIKRHASRAEAEADLEENVQRKLDEGFEEAGEGGGEAKPGAAAAPKKEAPKHEAPKKEKPVRAVAKIPPEQISAARNAIEALRGGLGGRSWKVRRLARAARRALERIAGVDPAKHGLGDEIDALMGAVVASDKKRLPLELAVQLLSELDPAALGRALKTWKNASGPAKDVIAVIATTAEAVDDADVMLAVGAAFADRQLDAASWRKRFARVKPELEEALEKNGSTLAKFLKSLDASDDDVLLGRVQEAAK